MQNYLINYRPTMLKAYETAVVIWYQYNVRMSWYAYEWFVYHFTEALLEMSLYKEAPGSTFLGTT